MDIASLQLSFVLLTNRLRADLVTEVERDQGFDRAKRGFSSMAFTGCSTLWP